jgi:hypothetical protein
MTSGVRFSLAMLLAVAVLWSIPSVSAANCPAVAANQICIDQPPVKAAMTTMPQTFAAGTRVSLRAGGCVNGGGNGWKRYVNPDPNDGGHVIFHGRAAIVPTGAGSAILPSTRFLSISPSAVFRTQVASVLQLGYEDDAGGYGDNGYANHSGGFSNQCVYDRACPAGEPAGILCGPDGYGGPAYVVLTVNPNVAPTVAATGPGSPVTGTTTLSASGSDPEGDAISYTYLIDGVPVSGPTAST